MDEFIEVEATHQSLIMRSLVEGVGVNDAPYMVYAKVGGKQFTCPYYSVWASMLARCYSMKYQGNNPAYRGCSVSEEWLVFTTFKTWMMTQKWDGLFLDKDLLVKDSKVYSKDTCIFVTRLVNNLMTDRTAARGNYPVGVTWSKAHGKYRARCNIDGKRASLGLFYSEKEASSAYRTFKSGLVKVIAEQQEDSRLREALLRISTELLQ